MKWACLAILSLFTPDDDLPPLLEKIKAVRAEGAGNTEAAEAWKKIVARGPDALLPVLAAFDGADDRAANWLCAAVDALASRKPLDAKAIEAFVLDRNRSGPGRHAAYEVLVRLDPSAPERLLSRMIDDPGRELRREAVAHALGKIPK